MHPQPKNNGPTPRYTHHDCHRHQDLSLLANNANVSICNVCFEKIKKTYFNIIAGLLLEAGTQHNRSRDQIVENTHVQDQLHELREALLRLQAEIGEIKRNGKNKPGSHDQSESKGKTQPPMENHHQHPDPHPC